MADKKGNPRKEIWKYLELADEGLVVSHGLESNVGGIVTEAEKKRDKYALEGILNEPQPATGQPLMSKEEFEGKTDEEKRALIGQQFQFRVNSALRNSIDILARNGDVIFKDESGKYSDKLVDIALSGDEHGRETINENADKKFADMIEKSREYLNYRTLARRIKEGRKIPAQNEEELRKISGALAFESAYKALKEKGYNEKLSELGARLAELAGKILFSVEKIEKEKTGIGKLRKEAKERLEKATGKDAEQAVAEYVADTLVKMVRSGNAQKEQQAVSLYHAAEKGHALGVQDFAEFYKPKERKL